MYILDKGTVVDGRFRVVDGPLGMSGQSMGYRAEDILAPESEKWRRHIFFKQYHDILQNQLGLLDNFFQALGQRVGDNTGRICLPVDRNIDNEDMARYEPACGIAGRAVYAAYPFVSTITLEEKLDKGLREEERKRIAIALLETLRRLARADVAHLDLKPSNIMIQEKKSLYIRLIDLDMARIGNRGLRKIGGTEYYMSPEHYSSSFGNVSCASDVFTLGILLSMILFDHHPFADADNYKEAIMKGDYTIPHSDYHPSIVSAIKRCLSSNPQDRPRIGEINSFFVRYFNTELKKVRAYVALGGKHARTYYDTVSFGYQEMRGMGIPGLSHNSIFCLEVEPNQGDYSIKLLDSSVQAKLGDRPMQHNKAVYLGKKCCLTINGKPLQIELIPY